MLKNFTLRYLPKNSEIVFLSGLFLFSFYQSVQGQTKTVSTRKTVVYVCLPCGQTCDNILSDTPGVCAMCHMRLVDKSTVHFRTISPADIAGYVQLHPDVVLLDVRTKAEFEGKADPNYPTLKNAINIPVQELESRLASMAYLKKKNIIVYCSRAHRSALACYVLTQNGFKHVTNMSGGVSVITPDELIR